MHDLRFSKPNKNIWTRMKPQFFFSFMQVVSDWVKQAKNSHHITRLFIVALSANDTVVCHCIWMVLLNPTRSERSFEYNEFDNTHKLITTTINTCETATDVIQLKIPILCHICISVCDTVAHTIKNRFRYSKHVHKTNIYRNFVQYLADSYTLSFANIYCKHIHHNQIR